MNMDEDAMIAAVDLIGRSGAKELEIAWDCPHVPDEPDDHTCDQTIWHATATWKGAKLTEDDRGPVQAVEALAYRILTGGKCRCGRLVALSDGGAVAFDGQAMVDGTRWTVEEARAAGQCRWTRIGRRWEPSCPEPAERAQSRQQRRAAERKAAKGQAADEMPTTERLARALEDTSDPSLMAMVRQARLGYYDDYRSPLPNPIMTLVGDLRAAGHPELARRAINGEFDGTKAEADAWAASPEGQEALREFGQRPGGSHG